MVEDFTRYLILNLGHLLLQWRRVQVQTFPTCFEAITITSESPTRIHSSRLFWQAVLCGPALFPILERNLES